MTKTLPKLIKATSWIPVCKYFTEVSSQDGMDAKIVSAFERKLTDFTIANPYSYKAQVIRETYPSIKEVIDGNTPDKAIKIMLLLEIEKIDLLILEQFLKDNFNLTKDQQNSSYYMKLVCLYDALKYKV